MFPSRLPTILQLHMCSLGVGREGWPGWSAGGVGEGPLQSTDGVKVRVGVWVAATAWVVLVRIKVGVGIRTWGTVVRELLGPAGEASVLRGVGSGSSPGVPSAAGPAAALTVMGA